MKQKKRKGLTTLWRTGSGWEERTLCPVCGRWFKTRDSAGRCICPNWRDHPVPHQQSVPARERREARKRMQIRRNDHVMEHTSHPPGRCRFCGRL